MQHSHLRVIIGLTLAIISASCAQGPDGPHDTTAVDYSKFVYVATISGNLTLASRLDGLLAERGIVSIIQGSAVYGIQVAPSQRDAAIAILKADSQKQGYFIKFDRAVEREKGSLPKA